MLVSGRVYLQIAPAFSAVSNRFLGKGADQARESKSKDVKKRVLPSGSAKNAL